MKDATATIAGAVTYWSLAEWSDVDRIRAALAAMALEGFAPAPPTPTVALRRALSEVFRRRSKLVRPLREGRFAVVDEERAGDDLEYAIELRASAPEADGDGDEPAFEPINHAAIPAVEDAYRRYRARVPALAVSGALTALAQHLGGVRLRESGGVFWLPADALDNWQAVVRAFEAAAESGGTVVYRLRTVVDDAAVRAVGDAVTREVEEAVADIREKVRDQVRPTALRRRVDESEAVLDKIERYEKILNQPLGALRKAAQEAEREASLAALASLGSKE